MEAARDATTVDGSSGRCGLRWPKQTLLASFFATLHRGSLNNLPQIPAALCCFFVFFFCRQTLPVSPPFPDFPSPLLQPSTPALSLSVFLPRCPHSLPFHSRPSVFLFQLPAVTRCSAPFLFLAQTLAQFSVCLSMPPPFSPPSLGFS